MGRSDCDNLGLISFKERFGAVGRPLYVLGAPRYREQGTRRPEIRALFALWFRVTPDFVLRMAGKLLYRHMG